MRCYILLLFCSCFFQLSAQTGAAPARAKRLALATEMERLLQENLLDRWYPRNVDTAYGGYLSTFTYDFKPTGTQDKFIVTQARHTWTTAKAAKAFPQKRYFEAASRHGFRFLRDVMWDREQGGFHSLVTRQGSLKDGAAEKTAYGNAFAIYALAAYYDLSRDPDALELAKKAFRWLERHSHDPVYGGYFQHLQRDGTPMRRGAGTPTDSDLGYKDQNSSIHLLEAFTELYGVWKDDLVRKRLEEMLLLIRDTIAGSKGYLTLFLTPDWKPVSFRDSSRAVIAKHKKLDHVSFGHDVETAYLMLEASHALGRKNDTTTMRVAKNMLDHALRNGWDGKLGGFYNEGYYFRGEPGITILFDSKNWWAQAEGLNTLLLFADHFPADTARYYDKFLQQWSYINTYLIDHEHGDWYEEGLDKEPHRRTSLKGHLWKGTYHHYRALASCIQQLRRSNTAAAVPRALKKT